MGAQPLDKGCYAVSSETGGLGHVGCMDLQKSVTKGNTLGHETDKGRLVGGWKGVLFIRGAT